MCRRGSKESALEALSSKGKRVAAEIAGGTPALRLSDHAAGNSIARVAGGVGLLVVSLCVNDEGCASVTEQRMAVGTEVDVFEVDIFIVPLEMGFAIGVRCEVGIVAGVVAFRIIQSMLFSVGIEMRPGGLEVRSIATRVLMEVDGMFAGREIHQVDFQPYSGRMGPKNCGAHGVALGIFELNYNFSGAGGGERHQKQCD